MSKGNRNSRRQRGLEVSSCEEMETDRHTPSDIHTKPQPQALGVALVSGSPCNMLPVALLKGIKGLGHRHALDVTVLNSRLTWKKPT